MCTKAKNLHTTLKDTYKEFEQSNNNGSMTYHPPDSNSVYHKISGNPRSSNPLYTWVACSTFAFLWTGDHVIVYDTNTRTAICGQLTHRIRIFDKFVVFQLTEMLFETSHCIHIAVPTSDVRMPNEGRKAYNSFRHTLPYFNYYARGLFQGEQQFQPRPGFDESDAKVGRYVDHIHSNTLPNNQHIN